LILIITSNIVRAEDDVETAIKNLPMLLGSSNAGNEFYMSFHPCWETSGITDGLKVYVTAAVATRVTLEIPGKDVFIQKTTIPNGIIEFNLAPQVGQCYTKTDRIEPLPQQVFKGFGIIITSDDPVVCYGVTRFQYTSDGYLAIPKSSLGKKYIVSSWNDPTLDNKVQWLTSYTSIVGAYDKTEVKVVLGGEYGNYTPGKDMLRTGDEAKKMLSRGDVWLIGVSGDYNDLSGTTVTANKPVAVISGSFCAYIPITISACDFTIEQDLPMETWGYKYHITPIVSRKKASFIRIYPSETSTIINRDGEQWAYIQGSGGTVGKGYISRRAQVDAEAPRPVTLSSDTRFSVTQYNCGQSDDGVESDPFQLVLTPVEQYQKKIVWCTPGVNNGSSFRYNYINLCYQGSEEGQIPDDMEFGHVVNGVVSWKKLSSAVASPGSQFQDPDVPENGRKWLGLTIALDDPAGVYALKGDSKFAAYGYGFDSYDSYGFPVSAALHDLTKPDIWAPTYDYVIDCHGDVQGSTTEQPENNEPMRSNFNFIGVDKDYTYNYIFKYDEKNFFPGETYQTDWSLSVIEDDLDAQALIWFTDKAGNDTSVLIQHKRTKFSMSSKITNWGKKAYDDPAEKKTITLRNDSERPVVLDSIILMSSDVNVKAKYQGFIVDPEIYDSKILPGKELAPGETLEFKIIFDPSTVSDLIKANQNSFIDSVGIKAYWSDDLQEYCYYKYLAVVKSSTGTPCIAASDINFGFLTVDNFIDGQSNITNNGSSALTITGYKYYGDLIAGIFDASNDITPISPQNPLVIPAGDIKAIKIVFNPKDSIEYTGEIELISDADDAGGACDTLDNIIKLIGWGKKPGLDLVGYQWPNVRTHLDIYNTTGHPYGNATFPYDCKINDKAVGLKMTNTGSESLTITKAEIDYANSVNPEYFWIDLQDDGNVDGKMTDVAVLNGLKEIILESGATNSKRFPVYYDPLTTGDHKVVITVYGSKNGFEVSNTTEFTGTSIYPKAETFAYHFTENEPDKTAIVGEKPRFEVDVKLKNIDWGNFNDDLTIYGVQLKNNENGFISTDVTKSGSKCFAFDLSAVNGELKNGFKVKPNEEYSFKAYYIPDKSSENFGIDDFVAHIEFITDATALTDDNVTTHTSEWRGKSITQDATSIGGDVTKCIYYPAEITTVKFTNTADDQLDYTFVDFNLTKGSRNPFSLANSADAKFTLDRNQSKTVIVKCDGDNNLAEDFIAELRYTTNIVDKTKTIQTADVEFSTKGYTRTATSYIDGNDNSKILKVTYSQNPSKDEKNAFDYKVKLDRSAIDMIEAKGPTDFTVNIYYNRNYLGAEFSNTLNMEKRVNVLLGSTLKNNGGYEVISAEEKTVDSKTNDAVIKVTIKNTDPTKVYQDNEECELLTLKFFVFQNIREVGEEGDLKRNSVIYSDVTTNEGCINIERGLNPTVMLESVCAQNTRLIQFTDKQFNLQNITPSPITNKTAMVDYSLGFDCNVTFTLYNEVGKIVAVPLNENKKMGANSFQLRTGDISSGIYFLEMVAGPYKETKRIMITK